MIRLFSRERFVCPPFGQIIKIGNKQELKGAKGMTLPDTGRSEGVEIGFQLLIMV